MSAKIFMQKYNGEISQLILKFGYKLCYEVKAVEADAILLPGGIDITPSLYSKCREPGCGSTDAERDYKEMGIINAAKLMAMPMIGICRGAQLLHVSFGGTLLQDMKPKHPHTHTTFDSEMHEQFSVNSTHHQGIPMTEASDLYDHVLTGGVLNEGPTSTEAFLDQEKRVLGVQYHPEYSTASAASVEYFRYNLQQLLGS